MENSLVINKDKLLLVEGKDDRAAIYKLVKELGIEDIQVAYMEGKDNSKKFIDTFAAALKTPTSEKIYIKAFGVILDADDNNPMASFQKVCSILKEIKKKQIKNMEFEIPKKCAIFTDSPTKVGVYIMPDCISSGMLETLCLKSVEDDPFYNCVEHFITEAINIKKDLDHLDKRKSMAFIALKSKNGQKKSVGDAVNEDIFNINSPAFDGIKEFLRTMSSL